MKNPKSRLAWGTCILALLVGLAATPSAQARTFRVLYTFTNGTNTGAILDAGLIADSAGNVYGTTQIGGAYDFGTVFKLDKTGKETVLYSFTGGADGANPFAGLVRDAAGNLYGTTPGGGDTSCSILGSVGCGVVFKLDTTGTETVLYTFGVSGAGEYPYAGLFRGPVGNLYGTTTVGGDNTYFCNGEDNGCGIVFKVDTTGKETVLHTFIGSTDGGFPVADLIQDSAGNLYGTNSEGGSAGKGTVFKLDKTQKLTVLYSFTGGADGGYPMAGLVRDAAGNLYGTTYSGGGACCGGFGTVFKLDAAGTETVLYSFTGGADGSHPLATLVRDTAGNLYGTTNEGGDVSCQFPVNGCGTVFEVDTTGKETVLHRFTNGADGEFPRSNLIRDAAGHLYGTAYSGGTNGNGVIFQVTP